MINYKLKSVKVFQWSKGEGKRMLTGREWEARIDKFIAEENKNIGSIRKVHRIYCQDKEERSGGGLYNETVTVDTIGRFARALGDSNPLFSDPEYASNSIYGGIIAPPLLECCICSTFIGGKMPRLRGISVYDAGTKWERFKLIRPGDIFSAETVFRGIDEITGETTGGITGGETKGSGKSGIKGEGRESREHLSRLLLRKAEINLVNQREELVSRLTARSIIKCAYPKDPETAIDISNEKFNSSDSSASVLASELRPHYSEEELGRIYENLEAQFRGDFRRGAKRRHWEDVEIGEELPDEIVGPYDESDGNSLLAAIGVSNAFATKWAKLSLRTSNTSGKAGTSGKSGSPGIIDPETGAIRHPIDRHTSDKIARVQGLPRALVYGIHSQALLSKSVNDWMGDEGFLCSLDCRCLKPLYYGDVSIQKGTIIGKYMENGEHFVKLRLIAKRQDGIVHTDAVAIVRLPGALISV